MGKPNFSDEFKRDAVAQITERGYPVAEVSERLGVNQHSLYAWKRQLAAECRFVVAGTAGRLSDSIACPCDKDSPAASWATRHKSMGQANPSLTLPKR